MKYFLLLILSICIKAVLGQGIYFPTVGDGAQDPKAEFGYLEGVPVEIYADSFDTLYCDNGVINKMVYDNNTIHYEITPKNLGQLTVTLISSEKGISDTLTASITVVNRPQLKLVADQDGDTIRLHFLDDNNVVVTDNFYCAMEIDLLTADNLNNRKRWISKWNEDLALKDLILKDLRDKFEFDSLVFTTTAVYSKEYGLYTGSYSCELKLKN